jgi:hypothetical protein
MAIKPAFPLILALLMCCGPRAAAPPAAGDSQSAAGPAAGDPPAAGPSTEPAAVPAPRNPPPQLVVDAPNPAGLLLDRLERSHADLRDFQADVVYQKWDNVLKRPELRSGEVLFQVKPDGTKRFAILLEKLIIRNRSREHRKHYVFDGSWLVEIDYKAKLFIKRQIVPPGRQFDPLKLGEGPFPLPVGQPKAEVLARFNVRTLNAPRDETLAERLAGRPVEGLLLIPKPGTPQADEFDEVELFYDPESLLPIGVIATETNGDRKTVTLRNLKRNAGVDESKLSVEQPDPREGWRIDIIPWEG